jgi:hypothetical protein
MPTLPLTHPSHPPPGNGWLLKAVSLGPWVHLIEELQVFDQEPMESLVLSQSKVTKAGPRTTVPRAVCLPLAVCLPSPVGLGSIAHLF